MSSDALATLDSTQPDKAQLLSDALVDQLRVLSERAFDIARSEDNWEMLVKTINALSALRGKLAPPPSNNDRFPTINFTFEVGSGRAEIVEVVPAEVIDVEPRAVESEPAEPEPVEPAEPEPVEPEVIAPPPAPTLDLPSFDLPPADMSDIFSAMPEIDRLLEERE